MLLRRSHQRLLAGAGGVATLCIRSCSCAIVHRCLADGTHSLPPPERTRRRPLSSGSDRTPQDAPIEKALPHDGRGEHPHHDTTKLGRPPFPQTPEPAPASVTSDEHGSAAGRQRHRGAGFAERPLPPRVGAGVAAAPTAAGIGRESGTDVAGSLGMEAVERSRVVVAAAGVTIDSSTKDRIDSLDPIDPLRSKRRLREQARGVGEEEPGQKSADGGDETWEDDSWETEKGVDGGGRGRGGGGRSGVGAPLGGAGNGLRTSDALSGEEATEEVPVDTEGGAIPPPADERSPRIGEERAHKMWVTMGGGATVLEHEWQADGAPGAGTGAGKDDTAVIQFYSKEKDDDPRFQGFGVVKEDKAEDIRTLVESFTAPALAAALRDRETALHECAHRLQKGDWSGVQRALLPFTAKQIAISRRALRRLDLDPEGFTKTHMYTLIKVLQRLPRHVTTMTEQRASVMIPLCNVDGVASVLFTKRSGTMRAHKNEICFPGGKVHIGVDQHIVQTALREMGEEIGILESSVDVLGVLRCDWAEVASLIGVAVTPVVGFLGNLSREQINPNPDEVSHCFTIPIRYLLQEDRWRTEKYKAPAFVGGPYVIWGLTGYILHRLVHGVLRKHLVIV